MRRGMGVHKRPCEDLDSKRRSLRKQYDPVLISDVILLEEKLEGRIRRDSRHRRFGMMCESRER